MPDATPISPPSPPSRARQLFHQLQGQRKAIAVEREKKEVYLQDVRRYLALAPKIDAALDQLSEELFGKLARTLEVHLTNALRDVLDQPIDLKVERDYKNRAATMRFYVERNGQAEDIMLGQGGSVANILSVVLRVLALMTLDGKTHRRFLVLDEQDCWLAPDLVPRLVRIVRDICRQHGFGVLMISHHELRMFQQYADRIYQCTPKGDGVRVSAVRVETSSPDSP